MNTERLNNDMFGKRPNYVKQVVIIGIIILLLIVAFTASKVSASTVPAKEDTYTVAGLFGDCMADYAKEDFYSTPDGFCGNVPTITAPPIVHNPVIVPPVVNPPTNDNKTCKNKNSGKDGTPLECNAGKGQEKHN